MRSTQRDPRSIRPATPRSSTRAASVIARGRRLGWRAVLCLGLAVIATPAAVRAQSGAAAATPPSDWPTRALTFVVPFSAGSATDQLARAIAQGVSESLGRPVVVDDRPGANGMLAAQHVARSAPDGYTLLITTNTTHAANQSLYKKLPYDPVKDFTPVTGLAKGSQILVVNTRSPYQSVGALIAAARAAPEKITFGSGSASSRMAVEMFQQLADVRLLHVPYKSNPMAVTDLVGGQIDMMITDSATGLPQIQAGKLRALATSASRRAVALPDLPTIAEAGVKGYDMSYWFAVYAPAGTPRPIVERLRQATIAAIGEPAARNFYESTGSEVFTTTPEGLAKFQVEEANKWARIIRQAGIEPE